MPDDAARDFVRALEMFPGRRRSSHPTPAKGGCVPGYAASERLPGDGVWQRKTAAAGWQPLRLGTRRKGAPAAPVAREREGLPPGNGTAGSKRAAHRARAHNAPGAGLHGTTSAPGAGLERD